MKRLILRTALVCAAGLIASISCTAQARNFDCSKPGNATKAACKATTARAAPAKTTAVTRTAAGSATSKRTYDCTKPGNASKVACRAAVKPAVKPAARVAVPAARPAAATPRASAAAPAAARASGAQGATGVCKDGTYTHAANHSGACSHHGGVKSWL